MNNREPGYYWVRIKETEWRIAEWDDGDWWLTGSDEYWEESMFAEIDERRIIRPPT